MATAAASPAGGLLATREEMQNLMDPAVALSELQSGIVELQEQLLAVQQHSEADARLQAARQALLAAEARKPAAIVEAEACQASAAALSSK